MRKYIIALLGSVLLAGGCVSLDDKPAEVKLRSFSADDNQAAAKVAREFADGFVKSLETGDFSFWQKQLPPENAAKITPAKFAAMRRELTGMFGDFEHAGALGMLVTGKLRNYLWKLTFSRKTTVGKTVYETVFFVRIFCEEGKSPAVSGFGVKRF